MKVQGKLKMLAHITTSGVVMDIAAFKVSHSVDIDATALRAARVRSSSIGAMEDMSQKVRDASTHNISKLRVQHHEHARAQQPVRSSVQGGNG